MSQTQVAIIMGSQSDFSTMEFASKILSELQVDFQIMVISAHRTPKRLYDFASSAKERGIKVIIAGSGGAAHLPGMISAMTTLPVVGVPIQSKALNGLDSLLSIVQMPKGVPVATMAIGVDGAFNAALMAAAILAIADEKLAARLHNWRQQQTDGVPHFPESSGV